MKIQKIPANKKIFNKIVTEEDGFSLFELLIVMILVSIFSAVIIPTYLGSIRSASLNTSANQISTDIRKAQARSMASGIRYGYIFTAGAPNYLYIKDITPQVTVETRPLPDNVTVLSTTFPTGKVSFGRSGAANQAGNVKIAYSDGTVKTISVVRITGKTSIQ